MFRTNMMPNEAMLFIFETPRKVTLWMKNTQIALDMLFFDKNKTLREIKYNVQPCVVKDCPIYPSAFNEVSYIVEIKGKMAANYGLSLDTQLNGCGL